MLALTHMAMMNSICILAYLWRLKMIPIDNNSRKIIINKVGSITLALNLFLAIFKLMAGILGKSSAMVADAIHTMSDAVTTVAVIIGAHFSSSPADTEHPYGHEKIESVVAKALAIVLFLTAIGIGVGGINTILSGNFSTPTPIALVAAIVSIVSKEWMYRYTVNAAEKIKSVALKADAWHHRSDALSSIGTLIGVGGAIMGFGILDPIASLVVSALIIKVSIDIYITGFKQLVDTAAPLEIRNKIFEIVKNIDGVERIDEVKTRMHGILIYVDTEISVNSTISVEEGHKVAEKVHLEIENQIDGVKHCMVHVNPYK